MNPKLNQIFALIKKYGITFVIGNLNYLDLKIIAAY